MANELVTRPPGMGEMRVEKPELGEKPKVAFDKVELGASLRDAGVEIDLDGLDLGDDLDGAGGDTPTEYYTLAEVVAEAHKKKQITQTYEFTATERVRLEKAREISTELAAQAKIASQKVNDVIVPQLQAILKKDISEVKKIEIQGKIDRLIGSSARRNAKHKVFVEKIDSLLGTEKAGQTEPATQAEVKKEAPKEVRDLSFDGEAFENDLVTKYGFSSLGELKKLTTLFTDNLVNLSDDYISERFLTDRSPSTYKLPEITRGMSRIIEDKQKLKNLRASLTDTVTRATIVQGLTGDQREDRNNYLDIILAKRLSELEKAFDSKLNRFQTKKDEIIRTEYGKSEQPELNNLRVLVERVDREIPVYTRIDQFKNLRAEITRARGAVSIDGIRAKLETQGMSSQAASEIIDLIKPSYFDKTDEKLKKLDEETFKFWKETFLQDKTQVPEVSFLKDTIDAGLPAGSRSVDILTLIQGVKTARLSLEAKRDTYVNLLPANPDILTKAHDVMTEKIDKAKVFEGSALESAKRKIPSEISSVLEIQNVLDAMNVAIDPAHIDTQEQTLRDALTAANEAKRTDIQNIFPIELHGSIDAVFMEIFGKDGKVEKRLEDFANERSKISASDSEKIKDVRRKIISDILELAAKKEESPDSFWHTPIEVLVDLQSKLSQEIADASKGGVPMQATEYAEARDKIDEFVRERKTHTVENMEKAWGEMRRQFRKPGTADTDPIAQMYKIAGKMDEIYKTDYVNMYRALEGLWTTMVDAGVSGKSDDIVQNLIWVNSDEAFHTLENHSTDLDGYLAYGGSVDADGNTLSDIAAFVREVFDADEYKVTLVGEDGISRETKWDYGSKGNPDIDSREKRHIPTLREIVKNKFPNTPDSVIGATSFDQVLCMGVRYPYIQEAYETWDQSPTGVQDFKPITISSPLSYCTYNEIKGRNTPKGYRVLRRLLRHPSTRLNKDMSVDTDAIEVAIRDTKGNPTSKTQKAHRPKSSEKARLAEKRLDEVSIAVNRANRQLMQIDIDNPNPKTLKHITYDDGRVVPNLEPEYVQLHSVEVGSDGIVFPYFSHILEGKYPGKTTASSYYKAYKAYDEFRDVVEQGPNITNEEGIAGNYKAILGKISTFKGIFDVMRVEKKNLPEISESDALAKGWKVEGNYYVHPHWHVLTDIVRMMCLDFVRAEWQQVHIKAGAISLMDQIKSGHPGEDTREYFLKKIFGNSGGDAPEHIQYFIQNVIKDAMLPSEIELLKEGHFMEAAKKKLKVGEYWRAKAVDKNPNRNMFSEWTAVSGRVDLYDAYTEVDQRELYEQYMTVNTVQPEGRADVKAAKH